MERCPTASVSIGLNCSWKLIACRANRLFLGLRIILHLLGTYCSLLVDQSAASELPWGQTLLPLNPAWVNPWKGKEPTQNVNWIYKRKIKQQKNVFPRYKSISLSSSDAAANKFFLVGCGFYPGLANVVFFWLMEHQRRFLVAKEHNNFPVVSCVLWYYSDSSWASQTNCIWIFPAVSIAVEARVVQIIMFWTFVK